MTETRPKSIRLFLKDGDPNGLIVATIPNWSGSVVLGRNSDLAALLDREEAARAGAYILFGEDPNEALSKRAYIGKASLLKKRITQHAAGKDWWDIAALISTTDSNFSTAHFEQLESQLIRLATISQTATIDNEVSPTEMAGRLGEADAAAVGGFLDDLKLLLPVLGIDILRPPPKVAYNNTTTTVEQYQDTVFELINRNIKLAKAVLLGSDFVVLSGSKALKDPGHTSNTYTKHRAALIEKGRLFDNGEYYEFSDDTQFSSPSKAAAVILDRNANGRTEWKADGQTFHDWQIKQSNKPDEDPENDR